MTQQPADEPLKWLDLLGATPDPHAGSLAALHLFETGPRAVYCTHCFAQPDQPCRDLDRGHHGERGWELRNQISATLRHALGLPMHGPVPAPAGE